MVEGESPLRAAIEVREKCVAFGGVCSSVAITIDWVLHDSADQIAGELRIPSREQAPGSERVPQAQG